MADVQTTSLYQEDFYLWTLEQSRALRILRDAAMGQGDLPSALDAIEWENLIGELDGLAKRDRRELQSRLIIVVEHLIKLEASSAIAPRPVWEANVRRERREIDLLLKQSPSIRDDVASYLESPAALRAVAEALQEITRCGEMIAHALLAIGSRKPAYYTETQALDDWWPEPAS